MWFNESHPFPERGTSTRLSNVGKIKLRRMIRYTSFLKSWTELNVFACRWYLMSSMLPLMRVSSMRPLRDPVSLTSETSRQAVKAALELRYSLLPYFYSLFQEASLTGVPVARPMFFEFPDDKQTWTIDGQFMIGPALMACPAFYKDTFTVPVYLPRENTNTTWYHFIGGHQVYNGTGGVTLLIPNLLRELVLLLRGGFILPYQVSWRMVSRGQFHIS
jgi:alpha-glucosidase (family GH31 glycosyl hydrolase)